MAIVIHFGFFVRLVFLEKKSTPSDDGFMTLTQKRSLSVSIKMSEDDLSLLKKAADHIWPKAVLTRSAIVLGLARIGAENALAKKK
jgi:hypothetical protein